MAIVVCVADLFAQQLGQLKQAGHTVRLLPTDHPLCVGDVSDADALLCLLTVAVDKPLLAGAPNLKIVANAAVGYENVDVAAAQQRGVVVTNTPDVLTEATADHAFALLLAAARRIAEADACVRKGDFPAWRLQQPLLGLDVHGKTLGIVGMGRIGSAVARRGRLGFDMRIRYHSRTRKPALEAQLDAKPLTFADLLAQSDFVSVHVPLTPTTRHLLDADAFAQMRRTAVLVNVSRGPVVDEAALVDALRAGKLAGAGLDVFEDEPAVHPGLLGLRERVVLAPHLGSATETTRRAMAQIAVGNVLAVLAGRPALTPVTQSSRVGSD